jgi:hypothetical protein
MVEAPEVRIIYYKILPVKMLQILQAPNHMGSPEVGKNIQNITW